MIEDKELPSISDLHDRVTKAAESLREFCDSVVIVCTIQEGTNTHFSAMHKGNGYACDASVQAWLKMRIDEGMGPQKKEEE
jgi:hypothetical protein